MTDEADNKEGKREVTPATRRHEIARVVGDCARRRERGDPTHVPRFLIETSKKGARAK
jgi:hypothetical protein